VMIISRAIIIDRVFFVLCVFMGYTLS